MSTAINPSPDLASISVVVPNFNAGATIAETLQSLVDQRYPKLEIIVVDGGSTDNSLEVIRSYEPFISSWVSEKDSGQASAINKGFARCTGEVVNWLCSDDLLMEGALHAVGNAFLRHPRTDVVVGRCRTVYLDGREQASVDDPKQHLIDQFPCQNAISQPSTFYRRGLLDRPHPLREDFHYAFDFELWTYFKTRAVRWQIIPEVLSVNRMSATNKSTTGGVRITYELEKIYKEYVKELIPLTFWQRHLRYPLLRQRAQSPVAWNLFGRHLYKLSTALLSPFYGYERLCLMNWAPYL